MNGYLELVSTPPMFAPVVSTKTSPLDSSMISINGPHNLVTASTKPKNCSPTTASGLAEPKALGLCLQPMLSTTPSLV
jgi:hypothetical protein